MLIRSTHVVHGMLALRTTRAAAARGGAVGREIVTMPLLAARLVGGFAKPAGTDVLYPAIQAALACESFGDFETVAGLPGMPRAVLNALDCAWRADLDLSSLAGERPRFHDLYRLETYIRNHIPPAHMLPRDLRDAASRRIGMAQSLLGPVTLSGLVDVDPLWRPLLNELVDVTELTWELPVPVEHPWFKGSIQRKPAAPPAILVAEASADPKSEVIEALRWTRQLLATGKVLAQDIAISATLTPDWDDHFLAYARSAGLPFHFSHGVPALSTPEGQACAALADVLGNGLNQERIWRLIRRLPARPFVGLLPSDWFVAIPRSAGLRTFDQWREVLAAARSQRVDGELAEHVLFPILQLLARGADAAEEAGARLLSGASLAMWQEALRSAPAQAIGLSLQALRVADQLDPANNVVWCPASQLAACPRPFTRLLGLTSRSWPRSENDDPLLPHHLLDRRRLHPVGVAERDRRHFEIIQAQTRGQLVLSRSLRNAKGGVLSPSSLWPSHETVHKRDRIPEHAFSEADRLLARPRDAGQLAHIRQAQLCWRNWQRPFELTPHDGLSDANHPAIEGALSRVQSTTSLQRLLRDPLGFVWRYALGWRSVRFQADQLQLDAASFGELVHELISEAITVLEPTPGFARASPSEIEAAITHASTVVLNTWPLRRSVPPPVLWRHTVSEAARRTAKGLADDDQVRSDTRSWTEVPFGQNEAEQEQAPWDTTITVLIGQTGLVFGGRMDRLDIRATGEGARITDYKSAKPPPKHQRIALGQGRELQRVLYAIAARTLLPEVRTVVARLIYLADDPATFELKGDELDSVVREAADYLSAAMVILRSGRIAPRWEQDTLYDDMRLALPADRESYLRRKGSEFRAANQPLNRLWSAST
ncbi:PD-(D/E)XK nuclease family protein [Mesorhizobium sp. CO1-1-8]|uniref:PD-(D/E)XK nuclease family protein n=1 Tax=Mesorhizobium sp. CO1-1-8 TaxID=2876631 RepID=UPI001CD18B5B|nr:PD-(D/E)XK nuclease family protein [Mesorhizobium sp. CO1-1-8]MBZ9772324.1 PD-(D/E)XK nuclease family protein [Mesorhizobium sp. CO1-1-8]